MTVVDLADLRTRSHCSFIERSVAAMDAGGDLRRLHARALGELDVTEAKKMHALLDARAARLFRPFCLAGLTPAAPAPSSN